MWLAQTGSPIPVEMSVLKSDAFELKEGNRLARPEREKEVPEVPAFVAMVLGAKQAHSELVGVEVVGRLDIAGGIRHVVQALGHSCRHVGDTTATAVLKQRN